MTPYELWLSKIPKLSFLKVWGYDAYVKKFQPDYAMINAMTLDMKKFPLCSEINVAMTLLCLMLVTRARVP